MNACDRAVARLRALGRGHVGEEPAVFGAPADGGVPPARSRALDEDTRAHLAGCSSCSDSAALLPLLDAGDGRDASDAAWARVAERLGDAALPETVVLRRPPLGWRVALAAAAGIGSLLLVPEPLQVLAALGLL